MKTLEHLELDCSHIDLMFDSVWNQEILERLHNNRPPLTSLHLRFGYCDWYHIDLASAFSTLKDLHISVDNFEDPSPSNLPLELPSLTSLSALSVTCRSFGQFELERILRAVQSCPLLSLIIRHSNRLDLGMDSPINLIRGKFPDLRHLEIGLSDGVSFFADEMALLPPIHIARGIPLPSSTPFDGSDSLHVKAADVDFLCDAMMNLLEFGTLEVERCGQERRSRRRCRSSSR